MGDIKTKVGSRIKEIRLAKGISQEELSLAASLNRAFVGEVERGKKNPTIITIEKICSAMDVSLHEFFSFEADEVDMTTDAFIKLSAMFKELNDEHIAQIVDMIKQIIAFRKS